MTSSIHIGDSLTVLRTLPGQSMDCCITDPPYGDTALAWDVIVNGWTDEVARVLKPSGSMWVFCSLRYLLKLAPTLSARWNLAQEIVWEKHNGSGALADRFRRVHEFAVQFYPRARPWGGVYKVPVLRGDGIERVVRRSRGPDHNGQRGAGTFISAAGGKRLERSVIRCQSTHGNALHPTQKPEAIVWPLMSYSCPPGGTCLDPFAGSGTTGVVAVQHGRSFIGIELNPIYAEMARKRIAAADPIGNQMTIEGVA